MPTRALVWFRRDLRVHDQPALTVAHRAFDEVVPVFVLDPRLICGEYPSPSRTDFLLGCLRELREALRERGGELVVREGKPEEVLATLAQETGATAVYASRDVSPFATQRDDRVRRSLDAAGVEVRLGPGVFLIADVDGPRTGQGKPYTVFSPYGRSHAKEPRREVLGAPPELHVPSDLEVGEIPALEHFGFEPELSEPFPPGETAARQRMHAFLETQLTDYDDSHDHLAGGTSELSPYLHFGCLSVRELEAKASEQTGAGPDAFVRQLAWRDFYAHVLLHHPSNAHAPHQAKYAELETDDDAELWAAWETGQTGYPVIDAAMRQLHTRGWMHNRARLLVGSFLTKTLHLDYRLGEAHFMRYLLCGDKAQNNGNWQWVASVGVDPKPVFQRIFNPVIQQERHDPDGEYVRRWLPELANVALERLAEPWRMSAAEQRTAGCVIGEDYPAPIVDAKQERQVALDRYRVG